MRGVDRTPMSLMLNVPLPPSDDPLEPDPPPNVPSAEDIALAEALRRRIERELLSEREGERAQARRDRS